MNNATRLEKHPTPALLPRRRGRPIPAAAVGLALMLMLSGAAGCGSDAADRLESFKSDWFAALRSGEPQRLYALLDAASKQRIQRQLADLRALDDPAVTRRVLDHLGGVGYESLNELTVEAWFALLWRVQLDKRVPDARFEVEPGARSGHLLLMLDDRQQRFPIRYESGRWVWALLDPPPPPSM